MRLLIIIIFAISPNLVLSNGIDSINYFYLKDWDSHLEFQNADIDLVLRTKEPQVIKGTISNIYQLDTLENSLNIERKPINFSIETDYRLVLIINYKNNQKDTIGFGDVLGMTINRKKYVVNTKFLKKLIDFIVISKKEFIKSRDSIFDYIKEINYIFNLE